MAFFTSPAQEVYEHRLKRSPSNTSVRARSRHPSGPPKSSPPSRTDVHCGLLPTLASDVSAPHPTSTTAPSIPSPVPAISPTLNEPDHDPKSSSPKLPRGSVPQHVSSRHHDDSHPLRIPSSVHDPELGRRRQQLDTSSPSVLPSPSGVDFDSGSLSDSGVPSRTPLSLRRFNLSSPSPHNVHISPVNARHHSPSSPNLPIASYFSDGERLPSLIHPSRLDVKRLLSKPAAPSVNSTLSITSDSESNALSRPQPNSNEAWPSKSRIQVQIHPSRAPPMESSELLPTSPPSPLQQRPRNLLRKRSASKQIRAAVSATLPGKMTTSSALQPTIRSPAAASPRSEFSTTTLQFVIASRAAVPASAPPHGSSSKLTPAGAIAQAYKEQDLRREAFASAARAENLSTVPASGSRLGAPDPTSDASVTSIVGKGKPYYTVFGSSPDRIVIVGSVEDKSADGGDYSPNVPVSGFHSASASVSAGQPIRSLTRKVSAHFRRGRPSVSRDGGTQSVHGDGRDVEHEHLPLSGDPSSRHERQRSSSFPKVKDKSDPLRVSIDQRNATTPSGLDKSLDGRSHRPMSSESTVDVVGPSPTRRKGKQKLREDDTGTSGRLWRLVKRISAGGLRERFHTTGAPVPPVPAIPLDLVPSRATLEMKMPIGSGDAEPGGGGDYGGAIVGYSTDPHPPTSAVWPNTDGLPSMTCGTPSGIPATPQGPKTISQPRLPSISSSPQSSEPTSTHFFCSRSSRSSFSSIVCSSPPPPLPPPVSALAQSPNPRTRSRAKSSASSPVPRPSLDDRPQTPNSQRTRTRQRSSPDIPAFSVSHVVNNFIVRRPSLARHQQQQHQNASTQSTTTPHPEETSALPPRPVHSHLRDAVEQDVRVYPLLSPGPSVQSHDSHSSSSTERPGSTSTSTISAHAVAGTSSNAYSVAQLTFRELGGTRRQAWTSQEKEDKWDDLLEKSARAGGTLHLGAESAGLASDNIRFSSSTLGSSIQNRGTEI